MDTASTSKLAAAKLIPKKLAAKRHWKKRPSNESFGSIASNEEHARGRSPSARERSGPGSLSTTQTSDLVEEEDDEGIEEDGADNSTARNSEES
jgi:hypothetical protein